MSLIATRVSVFLSFALYTLPKAPYPMTEMSS